LSFFLRRLLPGWVMMAALLTLLRQWMGVSYWLLIAIGTIWVAKDIVLIPYTRALERTRPTTGLEGLIGQIGVARSSLGPAGYVVLRGELWWAEADSEDVPISPLVSRYASRTSAA
jgi:membrane-bound ClpP family serine protease